MSVHTTDPKGNSKDFLFLHVRDLPYFRGLLRAVESEFYQDLDLAGPIYDLGCGDGHFASLTFDHKIDVGLDPWHGPIHEARLRGAYRSLVEADAARTPFPDGHFASGVSNSVLEHIPHIQQVLNETARC
jgi:ubiquinone/menaquinone biosynthesis C-methylase UbiE